MKHEKSSQPNDKFKSFLESNAEAIEELEELLMEKGHIIPSNLLEKAYVTLHDDKAIHIFEDEIRNKFHELEEKMYILPNHPRKFPFVTDEYKRITKELESSDKFQKSNVSQKQRMFLYALVVNIATKHTDDFWPIYKKLIDKVVKHASLN